MSHPEIDRDLTRLEAELKQLETEYTMYFAGRLSKPPWDTRARVEQAVRQMDRTAFRNTALKFRFNTIQARYAAFIDLWDRSLRAKEEGRGTAPFTQAGESRPTRAAIEKTDRVLHVTTVRGTRDEQQLDALYASLVDARRSVGAPEVPFEKFTKVVRTELERLRESGRADVTFRVTVKDGKAHLTARPRRSGRAATVGADDGGTDGKE